MGNTLPCVVCRVHGFEPAVRIGDAVLCPDCAAKAEGGALGRVEEVGEASPFPGVLFLNCQRLGRIGNWRLDRLDAEGNFRITFWGHAERCEGAELAVALLTGQRPERKDPEPGPEPKPAEREPPA